MAGNSAEAGGAVEAAAAGRTLSNRPLCQYETPAGQVSKMSCADRGDSSSRGLAKK